MSDTALVARTIEAAATVVSRDGTHIVVETERTAGCASCAAKSGCGTAAIGSVLGKKASRLRMVNDIDARVGDRVVLVLPETALLRAAIVAYILPVLAMIVAAATVAGLGAGDLGAGLAAVLGLGAGLLFARHGATAPFVLTSLGGAFLRKA
ncbi:SoxR reducing system RseC family protein [Rhodobium gokarnense]|uniref:Sigma-E factor negative regulatory protein RseC n=1 Tax=Rhodobium gokarnense TaxID=364296 RepID=A0ABT3H953_9HYPH|nr:SoxR reducing system RseC family protein [Rhodobium gokarnense]MCW2306920.1 sigma-E factor negative regulatory protein RseC [Rhodobium gokarnense]